MDYEVIRKVDFDPFAANPAASPDAAQEAPPAPAEPTAPPPETAPDVVVPKAPVIPVVKFAGDEKPAEPAHAKPNYEVIRKVDFNPFEKGSFIPEVAKGVAGGAVSTTGGMIKGMGGQRQQVMADERARQYRQKWLADNGYGDRIVEIATLPVQQQEALRAGMTAARDQATKEMDLDNDYFVKAGANIEKWGDDKFKAAADYQNSITRQLAEGFGSIAPFIAVNFIPGVGQAAAFEAGYASSVGQQMDDAIQAGATKQQILDGMRVGGLGGLTEQLPMEVLFERIPLPAMGKVMGAVVKVLSTAFAEGTQEGAQQAWQNIVANYNYDPKRDTFDGVAKAAAIGAIVGGVVAAPTAHRNHEGEDLTKVDDPDVADPAKQPGTPAAADPNAGASGPGTGTGATPKPPADVPKPAGPATRPGEVFTPAGRPAGPATQPGEVFTPTKPLPATPVEVTQPGQTSAEIAAALGGAEPAAAAQPAVNAGVTDLPEVDDTGEAPLTSADLGEQEGRIRDALRQQTQQTQAANANKTVAADPNAEIKAALAPKTPTVENPNKEPFKENIGTGISLTPDPAAANVAAPVPETPVSPTTPAATQQSAAQPAAAPVAAEPALVETPAAPVVAPKGRKYKRALQAVEAAGQRPTIENVNAAAATQDVAAFTPAPAVAADATKLSETATAETPVATTPAAPVVGADKAVEPVAKPVPGAKGAAIKAKVRATPAPVVEAKPAAKAPVRPVEGPTTVIKREALAARPEPKPAPAAAPEAGKAPRTQLSKDTAEHARDLPEMQRSAVSDLGHEFRETLHDVAAEHVAENPREKDQSPGDYIRKNAPRLVEKVKARLASAEEAKAQEDVKAKELLTTYGRKQAAKETKAAEKAAAFSEAKTGQQVERAGKIKGKSAEGIRTEKEKSTKSAYAKELTKPEAERDPSLMEWGRLDAEQAALPPRGTVKEGPHAGRLASDVRAEIMDAKAKAQEERALDAEAREAQGPQLAPRAKEAERATSDAIGKVDMPEESGSATRQVADVNRHFDEIDKATKDIPVAGKISTRHNSPAENLVIYARKVAANLQRNFKKNRGPGEEGYVGIGPVDFAVARKLYEDGAIDQMNDMIVSQQLEGAGYNEAKGEGKQAWTEEEASVREHETEQGYDPTEAGDEQARTGMVRASTVRQGRAADGSETVTVSRPSGGKVVVQAKVQKASALLKDLGGRFDRIGGNKFWQILRRAHLKHLAQLVGDIDVHFVSSADMAKLNRNGEEAAGLYFNYSNEQRAAGMKPVVFINTEVAGNPTEYAHTLIHEMTHAATSQAIRDNVRGTHDIIETMRKGLEAQLQDMGIGTYELNQAGVNYGFKDAAEFIAEAFSNEQFQKLLAKLPVSPELRRQVGAVGRGKLTWWDTIVATVSQAIGTFGGTRGHTYMDQVMRLSPQLLRSSEEQWSAASGGSEQPLPRAVPSGPLDEQMLSLQFNSQLQAFRDKLSDYTQGNTSLRNTFSTTGNMIDRSERVFGGIGNVFEKLAKLSLSRDSTRDKFRLSHGWTKQDPATGAWVSARPNEPGATAIDNNAVENINYDLKRKSQSKHHQAGLFMDDATRWQVNPTVPLSHHDNRHVSQAGSLHTGERAAHARLAAQFASFEPDVQHAIKANIEHYQKSGAVDNDANIRYGLSQVMKAYRKTLPPGKTMDDAVAWIRSGAALRDPANQTQEDKDYHAALGKTAITLAQAHEVGRVKGIYAPMQRQGKFFISARENNFGTIHSPTNLPAGAIAAATPAALKKDGPNAIIDRLMFPSRAAYDNFINSHPGLVHGGTMHVDPATGQKVPATFQVADPTVPGGIRTAQKLFVATVQNNRMEMSDSRAKLKQRAKEMIAQGHKVAAIRLSKDSLHQVAEDISPMQIKTLLKSYEQATPGHTTAGQDAVKGAILDAQIRTLNRPSYLDRNLKRRNVLGNDIDMANAMRDYNRGLSSKLANFQMGPQMAEADQDLQDFMDREANRTYDDSLTLERQRMASELRHRIKDMHYDSGPRALKILKDVTAWRTLVSPHTWIVNSLQPAMMTMPVFSARYGQGVAWKTHMQTLQLGGVSRTLGHGFRETWAKAKHLVPGSADPGDYSHDAFWRQRTSNEADAALLHRGMQEMNDLGYGASAGIELGHSSEADMGRFRTSLNRVGDMFRQMPEAIEANNRYTTLITGIRLAKLSGLSDDAAVRRGVLDVEMTQGGYSNANNPVFFSNPWLAPATQFRKYSLAYGQLYYNNLAWTFGLNTDPVLRKQAAKTLARLSLTTVAMAGIYGLPVIEIARMTMMMAGLLGLTDDDWDDKEASIQQWVSGMLKATGHGEEISEALLHGAPRLAGVDTSNNMSNSNLLTFNGPKSYDLSDIKDYALDQLTGASGGFLGNMYKALHNGDVSGAIPWPRVAKNVIDAYGLLTTGKVDPRTGEVYSGPTSAVQAGWKALGFRTADEARAWEVGGGGRQAKQRRETSGGRHTLMGQWRAKTGAEKSRFFREDVAAWNRDHPNPADKVQMSDLVRSVRSKKAQERRDKRAEQYED